MTDGKPSARLHRPVRALIAGGEVVAAVVAVWGAFRLWGSGVRTLTLTLSDGTVLTSTRYVGSWMAGAISLGMVAALLVVDAMREVMLSVRPPRSGRARTEDGTGSLDSTLTHLGGA